jgi:hypothetical protein
MNTHFLQLLTIDAEGYMRDAAEVAVYLDADTRAVYVGSLDGKSVTLERVEHRAAPDAPHRDREWSGKKQFGQAVKSPEARKEAARAMKEVRIAKERGELLALALTVVNGQAARAHEWAVARARHLAALDTEKLKRSHGDLLSALTGIGDAEDELRTQSQRLRFFQKAVELLGLAPAARDEDE